MKKALIVVDMQNDFVDGSLGTKEAQEIVEAVEKKVKAAREMGTELLSQEIPTEKITFRQKRGSRFRLSTVSKKQKAGRS